MPTNTKIAKNPLTWVLVADSKSAKIYTKNVVKKIFPVNRSRTAKTLNVYETKLKIIPGMEFHAESKDIFEKGHNKIGKAFPSSSTAHHMGQPHISIEDEIRQILQC